MIAGIRRAPHVTAIAVLVSLASAGAAAAQSYPAHPIRWIIGFPPGGPTDILVRLMGEWLQTRLGQPVVVENKPGAASNIATEAVVPVAGMSAGPSVLVVNPLVPAKSVPELIAYAKANPGKVNFGSPGVGST